MPNEVNGSEAGRDYPKWRGYLQPALILVFIIVALYLARAPGRGELEVGTLAASGYGDPVVSVLKPTPTEQSLSIELTGAVKVEARVTVMSEVEGRVEWVSPVFRNGGTFAANEPLVRLDSTEYALQVEFAQGSVAEAEARLAQGDPLAQAALQSAQAGLRLAELQLSRTEIAYPFAGRVITSEVGVGEVVGPLEFAGQQASMGIIYPSDALQVDAPIDMEDLAYLAPAIGRPAQIHTDSSTYSATIERVSSVVAVQSRLASVFLQFTEDQLTKPLPLPGTFVEVEIEGPPLQNVYKLPEAVLRDRDTVWVVNDGALRSVALRIIGQTGSGLVTEAFDWGEGVVVGSLPGAREGLEVDIVETSL